MNKPEYVKIENKMYKINTDFRVALECQKIAKDNKISDMERGLAIVYELFGEDGLNCDDNGKLLDLGIRYISLLDKNKKGLKSNVVDDFELDILKCEGLIRSSFKFDYNYDPYELKYLHWYDFYNDLANLSTSEFGNCCILNRVISILNQKPSEIKDNKERQKLIDTQKELKEKYCETKERRMTKEEENSANEFYKALGLI